MIPDDQFFKPSQSHPMHPGVEGNDPRVHFCVGETKWGRRAEFRFRHVGGNTVLSADAKVYADGEPFAVFL